MVPLSENTNLLVQKMCSVEIQEAVKTLLENECGNNLPDLEKETPEGLERFRFAVLRVGEGNIDKIRKAIDLAKLDWRDLLVAAKFADSVRAHELWAKEKYKVG
jgi:hypothetical protein